MEAQFVTTWPLAKAKAKLSEVIRAAHRSPQAISADGVLTAVVIGAEEYNAIMSLRQQLIRQRRQGAMVRLRALNADEVEEADFRLPERGERAIPDLGDQA